MTSVKSPIPGLKILLLGDSGEGKTHAIQTLVEAGLEVFCIFTEPGMSLLSHVPPEKLHWNYIKPTSTTWQTFLRQSELINKLSFQSLTEQVDVDKTKYNQFLSVIKLCNNFVDERTGKEFGDILEFNTGRVVVIDSLSGLNDMVMDLVVGGKPVKAPGEWQIAMDRLEKFIKLLVNQLNCHLIINGHLERETDEVTGAIKLMTSTLGRKVAPRLPRYFDEVIRTTRTGTDFHWSTASSSTILKTRHLAFSEKLLPTYVPLVEGWKKKGGVIETIEKAT